MARVTANIIAYKLERNQSVRICLGDAITGNSGMFELVKRAPHIIAIEGCPLKCGTEMMKKRMPELNTIVVNASSLYNFDREKYFEIFDLSHSEIEGFAKKVAEHVQRHYFNGNPSFKLL